MSLCRLRSAFFAGLLLSLSASPARGASKEENRETLKQSLLEIVKRLDTHKGRVSVAIQSLDDGTLVFAHNADELLNPASNVKLFTSAAALFRLGPDYRYDTDFLSEGETSSGRARTLYVRGKGDPSIVTERLFGIVGELAHAGLREISGDIVIDDSYFDVERLAPGYDQESSDRAYMAPSGAVSLNWNSVAVYLRPAAAPSSRAIVEVEPLSDYFIIETALSTGRRRQRRFSVASEAIGQQQKIRVRGTVPVGHEPLTVWKKIDNPPIYFGETLKKLLENRGIKVRGKVRLGAVSSTARVILTSQSETLDLVLKRLNKSSSNFVAEQLIKTMGAEGRGAPGTFANGIQVVEEFLEQEVGISRGSYVMKNGSGLNDTNRFSAAQMTKLLKFMYDRFPLAPEFVSSLGIAGKDGTVRYRFEGSDAVGRLRAKTGTLENVSALSGYVQAIGGEKLVFSMMVNDYEGRSGPVVQSLDALGIALASSGSVLNPDSAVAHLKNETTASSKDELKTRIKTYLSVGKPIDRRNLAFLRTAWRSERDSAARAVIADALFQSNPQDYLGQRALLDSFTSTEDVYSHLRTMAKELNIPVPGVSSLLDLAAEGNVEALAHAVELARQVTDDPAREEVAEGLADAAKAAPEELVVVLRNAKLADREAAIALLSHGLVKAAEAEHPLWPTLRKFTGAIDSELATFARSLESLLSTRIAQEKAPGIQAMPAAGKVPPKTAPSPEIRPGG